jgi:lysophospholipid acyltransferase (LPLAT)-like uncharacterized protein
VTTDSTRRERTDAEEARIRRSVRYGGWLLAILARTWRMRVVNADAWRALHAARKPCIVAFWHGEILGSAWFFRHQGVRTMVSTHGDGEIIARLVAIWGIGSVRGSSSRGGGNALRQMVSFLEEGNTFAITPDGPRGPAGVPQSGVLLASKRTGAPIFTVRIEASRAWRMNGWDRFMVPKPFARLTVTFGDPWVATGTDEAALAEFAKRMGPALGRPVTAAP